MIKLFNFKKHKRLEIYSESLNELARNHKEEFMRIFNRRQLDEEDWVKENERLIKEDSKTPGSAK